VILATSREPLRVAGEHLYDVPGMEVPEPPDLTGPERPDTPFSQERGQLAEIGN
jgi:predicted ATPase